MATIDEAVPPGDKETLPPPPVTFIWMASPVREGADEKVPVVVAVVPLDVKVAVPSGPVR